MYTLIFFGVLAVVNWLASRHNHRWDLTKQNVFSLSTQSKSVLAKLDSRRPGCLRPGRAPTPRSTTSSTATATRPTTHLPHGRPDKERDLAGRYKVTELPTLHIQYGEQTATVTRDISEEAITNGLIKATRTTKKVACFLDGHGEPDPENREARGVSGAEGRAPNENYETRKVLLATEARTCPPSAPSDRRRHRAAALRSRGGGPQQYLNAGRSVLFLVRRGAASS